MAHFERTIESKYALAMRDEALRVLDAARDQGAIAAKSRRIADRPLVVQMDEVPNLFVVLARRLGHESVTSSATLAAPPGELPDQLDSLMREGMDLVTELSEPVRLQRAGSGWQLEGGDAPEEWRESADGFAKRVRKLLVERHPALLTDYRDGYNAHLAMEREKSKKRDPADDERSDTEKMLAFANFERSGPRRVVEASLEGIAAARHRLGPQQIQHQPT